jgi:hypothetical protein
MPQFVLLCRGAIFRTSWVYVIWDLVIRYAVTVTREDLLTGRLSTVNPLVLTSLDRLLLIIQTIFIFLQKQATLMRINED